LIDLTEKQILEKIAGHFSIAKFAKPVWRQIAESTTANIFVAKTEAEFSVIAPDSFDFSNATDVNSGWRGMKVVGQLDFGIVGLLADVTRILADGGISVVAVSTFDTDYFFVKSENFELALAALGKNGFALTN